jgi:hypothetical protein
MSHCREGVWAPRILIRLVIPRFISDAASIVPSAGSLQLGRSGPFESTGLNPPRCERRDGLLNGSLQHEVQKGSARHPKRAIHASPILLYLAYMQALGLVINVDIQHNSWYSASL